MRCSHIYKKGKYTDEGCPVCGSIASIDICEAEKIDGAMNEIGIRRLFFDRLQKVYGELNLSIWGTLGRAAWKSAEPNEKVFLAFCMAFLEVSGKPTNSESEFWDIALAAEAKIRGHLVERKIQINRQDDFEPTLITNGLLAGTTVRTLQSHYGTSVCGSVLEMNSPSEVERKYEKAMKVTERLAVLGCSSRDNLPYFNAATYLEENPVTAANNIT